MTGRGGDILIVDDPLSASDAFSDAMRRRANEWFSRTLVSRLDNKQTGAIIVIMQRLHQEDLTGHLLERGGWELLNLPAVAPEDRDVPLWNGTHSWKVGEALQPNREPINVLQQIKADLGAEAFNAQYLQDPVPAEGNMLKRAWLREYEATPFPEPSDQIVQSWDTALTANESSKFSVCLTFRVRNSNEYYLLDVFREKLEFPDLKARRHSISDCSQTQCHPDRRQSIRNSSHPIAALWRSSSNHCDRTGQRQENAHAWSNTQA